MEQPFSSLFTACLRIGLGMLLASSAWAIPGGPDAMAGFAPPVPAPAVTAQTGAAPGAADEGAATPAPVSPDAQVPDQAGAAPAIPCMQGSLDGLAEGDAGCDSPTAEAGPLSVRLGRRIGGNSGIPDDYDGIRVDYRFSHGLKLNAMAGYQDLSGEDPDPARRMLGVSADTGSLAGAWGMNGFYLQRQDEKGAFSRVIGGALRYLRPRRSVLVFADYDITTRALGALTLSGAWKPRPGTTLSTTLDLRNSSVDKRQQNYLQQQAMGATEGWNPQLPTDRIRHFTEQRSDTVRTLAFGLTHRFSGRVKLAGSVAMLDAPGGPATGAGQPSEYFYNLKLTGRNLVLPGDTGMLDLQHRVTDAVRSASASINTRYAVNRAWNISPRLRADYRDHDPQGSVRWATSPAVQMEYRGKPGHGFQIEAGGEWSSERNPERDSSRASYFVSLGYKASF